MRRASIVFATALVLLGCGDSGESTGGGGAGAHTAAGAGGSGGAGGTPDPCADHCENHQLDCGETAFDCGGECAACPAFDVATVCGPAAAPEWSNPHLVAVENADSSPYAGSIEEPEVRDFGGSRWLFFNDDPSNGNKDLFYARWDELAGAFIYLGAVPGPNVATPQVDGNPTLDEAGEFFFVSTRTYPNPTESIHQGTFTISGDPPTGTLTDLLRLDGLSRTETPWVTQGVQVSWDGAWLFFDEAKFDTLPPSQSDVVAARREAAGFTRLADEEQASLFAGVNTSAFLEYAESISRDGLELYFTRAYFDPAAPAAAVLCLMRSTRASTDMGFGPAVNIGAADPQPGVLMEAPALSPDEKTLYYHRRPAGELTVRLFALERL
ncbi:MAG: hypothetical protein U0271_04345 [Polyangiaceae bacterium]